MEKIRYRDIELSLGITHPWTISDVKFDDDKRMVNVFLASQEKRSRFSFFDSIHSRNDVSADSMVEGEWQYTKFGNYRSVIHAQVPSNHATGEAIGRSVIAQPCFLGDHAKRYSNLLRQQIAQARTKGLDEVTISEQFELEKNVVRAIVTDLDNSSTQTLLLSMMPTEVSPTWELILRDKVHIKTNSIPLKMLLSKLKLAVAKDDGREVLDNAISELRQFFVANCHVTESEIRQICGVGVEKPMAAKASTPKTRLILPAIKSHIWIDILAGRLKLNSHNVALNLLISRQRISFIDSQEKQQKVKAISTLRDYIHENHRNLRQELLLINRALAIRKGANVHLPNADHEIWKKILHDESFIPSEHMAYKLLLSKLRAQINLRDDPVVEMEAARSVRNFLHHNQRSMRKELSIVLKCGNEN